MRVGDKARQGRRRSGGSRRYGTGYDRRCVSAHLGVSLGVEGVAIAGEHFAERAEVLDDAVVLEGRGEVFQC